MLSRSWQVVAPGGENYAATLLLASTNARECPQRDEDPANRLAIKQTDSPFSDGEVKKDVKIDGTNSTSSLESTTVSRKRTQTKSK